MAIQRVYDKKGHFHLFSWYDKMVYVHILASNGVVRQFYLGEFIKDACKVTVWGVKLSSIR